MNPLFSRFGNQQAPQQPQAKNPLSNITNMITQFQQFKNAYRGNAQQEVQQMLSSGQITQEQLNQVIPIAQQIQKLIH